MTKYSELSTPQRVQQSQDNGNQNGPIACLGVARDVITVVPNLVYRSCFCWRKCSWKGVSSLMQGVAGCAVVLGAGAPLGTPDCQWSSRASILPLLKTAPLCPRQEAVHVGPAFFPQALDMVLGVFPSIPPIPQAGRWRPVEGSHHPSGQESRWAV